MSLSQQIANLPPEARKALFADLAKAEEARASGEGREYPDAMSLAGASYELGGVTIPPISFGALACLEESGNPLLREGANVETASMMDVYEVLFVAANQDVALPILYRLSRCRATIEATAELAKTTPEHYERYLAARQRLVEDTAGRWDAELRAFAAKLSGVPAEEVRDAAKGALEDALRPFSVTP